MHTFIFEWYFTHMLSAFLNTSHYAHFNISHEYAHFYISHICHNHISHTCLVLNFLFTAYVHFSISKVCSLLYFTHMPSFIWVCYITCEIYKGQFAMFGDEQIILLVNHFAVDVQCDHAVTSTRMFVHSVRTDRFIAHTWKTRIIVLYFRHCGLVVSALAWDGTGCEFDSWQCRVGYISHVHRAYNYLSPFGVLWVHMAWHKNCVKKFQHAIQNTRQTQDTNKKPVMQYLFIYLFHWQFKQFWFGYNIIIYSTIIYSTYATTKSASTHWVWTADVYACHINEVNSTLRDSFEMTSQFYSIFI